MSEYIKYDNHENEWEKVLNDASRKKIATTWLNQTNSMDRWRHDRMYKLMGQLIKYNKNFSWLTVGDGRYGTDANALLKLGAKNGWRNANISSSPNRNYWFDDGLRYNWYRT